MILLVLYCIQACIDRYYNLLYCTPCSCSAIALRKILDSWTATDPLRLDDEVCHQSFSLSDLIIVLYWVPRGASRCQLLQPSRQVRSWWRQSLSASVCLAGWSSSKHATTRLGQRVKSIITAVASIIIITILLIIIMLSKSRSCTRESLISKAKKHIRMYRPA